MRRLLSFLLLLIPLSLAVFAAAPSPARVTKVLTAKTLELEGGDVVRLAAIQAPNRARHPQEKDEPLAVEAFDTLKKLADGQTVMLKPIGKERDRKNRIVAEASVDGQSLQEAMLRAGMAWVYTFTDTRKLAKRYYAAEAEAEKAGRGVWGQAEYAVLDAAKAEGHDGEFRLVRGVPTLVAIKDGERSYINFGDDWKTDFTLVIARADLKRFDRDWLESLKGKQIRVRGWLFTSGGPAMELTHPEQVEVLS